jgi:hypothetical protein
MDLVPRKGKTRLTYKVVTPATSGPIGFGALALPPLHDVTEGSLLLPSVISVVRAGPGTELDVLPIGVIRGKAGEKSRTSVRCEFAVVSAEVRDDLRCLTMEEVRHDGKCADVVLGINSRRSGSGAFSLTLIGVEGREVKCEGRVIISRPAPSVLAMRTFCGGSVSMKCPIQETFAEDRAFSAFLEPAKREFWLSKKSGVIEAGAKEFPFSIFFAPRDIRPVEALLVIECGDVEICVRVCGITTSGSALQGGFDGQRWGVKAAAPSEDDPIQ